MDRGGTNCRPGRIDRTGEPLQRAVRPGPDAPHRRVVRRGQPRDRRADRPARPCLVVEPRDSDLVGRDPPGDADRRSRDRVLHARRRRTVAGRAIRVPARRRGPGRRPRRLPRRDPVRQHAPSADRRDERLGIAAAVGAAIVYGAAYPATAVGLRSFSPLAVAGLANTIALVIVMALAVAGMIPRPSPEPLSPPRLQRLLVLAAFGG